MADGGRAAHVVAGGAGLLTAAAMATDVARPFVYDEAVTVRNFVEGTPSVFWSFSHQVVWNNHPFFSFLERLVWGATGSASPTTMRVLPIVFASAAVALLTSCAYRRFGLIPSVVAAVTLGANPMFWENAPLVRGYGLVVMCTIVGTATLAHLLRPPPWRLGAEAIYVVALAVAIATHLYSVFVFACHVAYVLGRGRVAITWVVRWLIAALLGGAAYVGMWSELPIGDRPRAFEPLLPWHVVEQLLGGDWRIAAPMGLLCVVALSGVCHPRAVLAASAVLTIGFIVVWLLVANFDTYPRFFMWAVPGVAWAAAAGTARIVERLVPAVRRRAVNIRSL